MSTSSSVSQPGLSAASANTFSSSSKAITASTTSSQTITSQSPALGFSSSTFFPFSPPSSSSASPTTSSTPPISQIASSSSSSFPDPSFPTSLSLPPLAQTPAPSLSIAHPPASDAQTVSDSGPTWSAGEIALVAVCSFIILLAVAACILVVVIRRRQAKREMEREFDFHVPPPDAALGQRRESIGSVEKYGYGYTTGGAEGKAYLAGLSGSGGTGHNKSLSTDALTEAETRDTAPLLSRKVRPASSRHSRAAVYGDEDSSRSLYGDGDDNARSVSPSLDGTVRGEDEDGAQPRQQEDLQLEPSSPTAVPFLASASSPPPPSPRQQDLMRDLQSVQNLYTPQPPSRRSSRATRRSSRRTFTETNINASSYANPNAYGGYDSDDSESMYSQASAPVSISAPSLISSKSIKSLYARQSRTGGGLMPPPSGGVVLGPGGLPPIPQSPSGASVYGAQSQRQSVMTIQPSPSSPLPLSHALQAPNSEDENEQENALSNIDQAIQIAKLLQSRQKNSYTEFKPSLTPAPGAPTRPSSLTSHIERSGSIRPVLPLALDSVEEGNEPGSTLGRRR